MKETKRPTLTLYYIPSPFGLNWTTPTSLARTIVLNKLSFQRRFMGHVNIELEYKDEAGEEHHFLTGMVASKLNAVPLLLKEKIGLGILFHSFDGRLESKEELEPELTEYFKKGNKAINFSRYLINLDMAKRIHQYLEEYRANEIGKYYGLVNSPLHGEGSGCSAFGASFLDVAGILNEEYKEECSYIVRVPHRLAGKPINNSATSFFKMLLTSQNWADPNEDHHEIMFWDPDLMHKWVEKKILNYHSDKSDYSIMKIQNTKGICFDVSQVTSPSGDIFKINNGKAVSRAPNTEEKSNLYKYR